MVARSMAVPILIYGAYGYTGALIAEEAVRRGHRPVLAGRDEKKVRALGKQLDLEARPVGLGDPGAIREALRDVKLVLHCAGPFIETSTPMLEACLDAGAHYLDITGEVPVFQRAYAADEHARRRGIAVISGVGFDVVPSDCLASFVVSRVPQATQLEIAINATGGVSAGTLKSALAHATSGMQLRRGGELVTWPIGKGTKDVQFGPNRIRTVMPITWGDLESAFRSTGVPDITTYMSVPRELGKALKMGWPFGFVIEPLLRQLVGSAPVKGLLARTIEQRVQGPDAQTRQTARAFVWARATNADGQTAEAWLETVEAYRLTAEAAVRAAERVLEGGVVGALSPAQAFGPDFILEIEGTQRHLMV